MGGPFTEIAQILVDGLMTGGLYALQAMGLMIIYGVLKILNFAHGELLLTGAYLMVVFFPINPFLGVLVSIPVLALLALGVQKTILSERVVKNASAPLIVTFGLSLILQNAFYLIFTANPVGVPIGLGSFVLSNVIFPLSTLLATSVAVIALLTIHLFLSRTFLGTAIRAATESPEDAALVGVDVKRVRLLAFVLGAVLTGFSGTILVLQYSITPFSGLLFTLKAVTIIVLGGFSTLGLIMAGMVLGVAESFWGNYFPTAYTNAISFVVFLVVVIVKPSGLFGKSEEG